jgi:hypothetical protein
MSYAVRYRRRALEELNACAAALAPNGQGFLECVKGWLQDLADEAERNETGLSVDAKEFLELLGTGAEGLIPKTGLDRWRAEGIREKIRAFLILLRDRSPPWTFRMAMEVFLIPNTVSNLPSHSPGVVLAFYEVDRVNEKIIVTHFPELPCPTPGGAA